MGPYEEWSLLQLPGWAQDDLTGSIGAQWDAINTEYIDATKARFPALAPADALVWLGMERKLEQVPGETAESFAARLEGAWDTYQWAGTDKALIDAMALLGYSSVQVVRNNPTPPDGDDSKVSRIWLHIQQPHSISKRKWGAGGNKWGEPGGRLWGTNATREQVELIRRALQKWKASHCWVESVVVEFSDGNVVWPMGF